MITALLVTMILGCVVTIFLLGVWIDDGDIT